MKAIVISGPDKTYWKEVEGKFDLKELQAYVAGRIESIVPYDAGFSIYTNEEGRILDLPIYTILTDDQGNYINALHGTVVILGPVDDEGEITEITDEALKEASKYLHPAHPDSIMTRIFIGDVPCSRCGGIGLEPAS